MVLEGQLLEEAKVLDIFLIFFLSEAFTEGLEFLIGVELFEFFIVVTVEIDYASADLTLNADENVVGDVH